MSLVRNKVQLSANYVINYVIALIWIQSCRCLHVTVLYVMQKYLVYMTIAKD